MLSRCLRQILTRPSECRRWNRDSSDQAKFFQSSIVQFWRACANCSLSFLLLADRSVVFRCRSPSSSRFHELCVQRWYSAFSGCDECLFELLLPSCDLEPVCPISSDLSHQRGMFIHTAAAHWIFSLFQTILCKPYRWLCVKIPVDQQFLEYSEQPVWHQQPCHVQSHLTSSFFPILMLGLNLSKLSWPPLHIKMRWVATMRLAD